MLESLLILASTQGAEQQIIDLLNQYGPIVVFFALFAPLLGEEPIVVGAGIAIGHGHLPAFWTWVCAYLGVLASDSIWYFLCFIYGSPLLHKPWFKRLAHPRRLLQAKHQMEKRGAWVIVTGRFLPGSRTAVIVMSGLLHLPPWKFYLAEGICAAITVSLQMGGGYLVAKGIGSQNLLGTILTIVAVLVVMFAATALFRVLAAHRASKRSIPRAKASWLRKFRGRRIQSNTRSAA